MASLLSIGLRLPIERNAQFTAFFTKLRLSVASRSINRKPSRYRSSGADLSCTVRLASMAKEARFTNSSSRVDHSRTLGHACGERSQSTNVMLMQTVGG